MKKINYTLMILLSSLLVASCGGKQNESSDSSVVTSNSSEVTNSNSSEPSTSTNPDGSLTNDEFVAVFQKDYSNVTYSEIATLTIADIDSSYSSLTTATEDAYQVTFSSQNYVDDYFVEFLEDNTVKLYVYNDEISNYEYEILTEEEFLATDIYGGYVYADYMLAYLDPNTFNISVDSFDFVDGVYKCKTSHLARVGLNMFGNQGFTNCQFSKIEITIADGFVSKVDYDFSAYYSTYPVVSSVSCEYESIGSTTVYLPTNAVVKENPYYGNAEPDKLVALTNEQKNTLDAIFNGNFSNYTCTLNALDGDQSYAMSEIVKRSGDDYKIEGQNVNGESYSSYNYYLADKGNYYQIYEHGGSTVATDQLTLSQALDYLPFAIAPQEHNLKSDYFNYYKAEDGTEIYACSKDGLKEYTKAAIADGTLESDGTYVTIEAYLDENHNLETILTVTHYKNSVEDYLFFAEYDYSDYNSTTVTIPTDADLNLDVTEEQLTAFNSAISNYLPNNVTIYDTLYQSQYALVNNTLQALETYDGDQYVTTFVKRNDKWCIQMADNSIVDFPYQGYNFEDFVPVVDFSALDVSKLRYDNFNDCYYINIADIELADFAPYYLELNDIYPTSRISFTVDDENHFTSIYFDFYLDGIFYTGYGITLSSYGTTQLFM